MPRAEAGTIKHLSNKMKSRGLQRLRFYCQVCEKQTRDENGYKCHVMSESHMRRMAVVAEDPNKHIALYSAQFKNDFLKLLQTMHGEKPVHVNHFYQEYIRDKDHIRMGATKWHSLTEFAKWLGREGLCRVTEEEKGIHIAWVDASPEALRRREALKKTEKAKVDDEQLQNQLLKAQEEAATKDIQQTEPEQPVDHMFEREEGEKVKMSFSLKPVAPKQAKATSALSKPGKRKTREPSRDDGPKKMTNMERIMRDEMARRRRREETAGERDAKRERTLTS